MFDYAGLATASQAHGCRFATATSPSIARRLSDPTRLVYALRHARICSEEWATPTLRADIDTALNAVKRSRIRESSNVGAPTSCSLSTHRAEPAPSEAEAG